MFSEEKNYYPDLSFMTDTYNRWILHLSSCLVRTTLHYSSSNHTSLMFFSCMTSLFKLGIGAIKNSLLKEIAINKSRFYDFISNRRCLECISKCRKHLQQVQKMGICPFSRNTYLKDRFHPNLFSMCNTWIEEERKYLTAKKFDKMLHITEETKNASTVSISTEENDKVTEERKGDLLRISLLMRTLETW